MHRSRLLVLCGAVLGGIALLLPLADLSRSGPVSGWEGDAWPALVLLAPAIVIALSGDRRESPPRGPAVIGVLSSAGAFAFSIVKHMDARAAVTDAGGSLGLGAWFLPGALLVALAGTLYGLTRRVH